MYRTLIRFVVRVDDCWYVAIPAWGLHALIGLKKENIPKFIWDQALPNKRLHAMVNLSEIDPVLLSFQDWEED